MNVCTKSHGNPSDICQDISLKKNLKCELCGGARKVKNCQSRWDASYGDDESIQNFMTIYHILAVIFQSGQNQTF